MKIVVEIDPGRQEFAAPGHTDAEVIIRRRLAGAPDGRIQVQGFIATIVGEVTERQEVSYDLFGNESSYPVDVIGPLEGS